MGLIGALDCKKNNYNVGTVSCEIFLKEFKTPILIKKGWRATVAAFQAFTEDDIVELIQTGVWIPLVGSKQFTNNTPDPTTEEYTGGIINVIRNGLPQYQWDFDKGVNFHRSLYGLNGSNNFDVAIVDKGGNLVFALSPDGLSVSGFDAGMTNTRTFMPPTGDTSSMTSFEIQLTNEDQFNRRLEVMTAENAPTDFNNLWAIVGVVLNIINTPAVGGTSLNVQVRSIGNRTYGVNSLDVTNFRLVNTTTNALVTPSAVTAQTGDGNYTLTVAALTAGTYELRLYDLTLTVFVARPDDTIQLYAGSSKPFTIA